MLKTSLALTEFECLSLCFKKAHSRTIKVSSVLCPPLHFDSVLLILICSIVYILVLQVGCFPEDLKPKRCMHLFPPRCYMSNQFHPSCYNQPQCLVTCTNYEAFQYIIFFSPLLFHLTEVQFSFITTPYHIDLYRVTLGPFIVGY
jgi:hypothetical protein